jgi:4-hydroxy-tetrahydrodipicolinate reductase
MRIALIGYGKMGKLIEEIAVEQGHSIVLKISSSNRLDLTAASLSSADVAIEFTNPESAYENVKFCLESGIAVISGSTGWNEKISDIISLCKEKNGSFLHASNFSIGVNIFFAINTKLAELMASQSGYEVSLKEIHHTAKKDAPSGTAVTLAEQILSKLPAKTSWVNGDANTGDKLSIISERVDPAPGTHHVKYDSEIDSIEIIHTAHNRKGFASGAVKAAEFVSSRKGVFTMKDVLGIV